MLSVIPEYSQREQCFRNCNCFHLQVKGWGCTYVLYTVYEYVVLVMEENVLSCDGV